MSIEVGRQAAADFPAARDGAKSPRHESSRDGLRV